MSKRLLLQLVTGGRVPAGRPAHAHAGRNAAAGLSAGGIRDFCERIGVAKTDSLVDIALLEHCVREHLNKTARASWPCCGR